MGFKSGADGVTKQGKTKGKNLGDSGPSVGIQSGKGSKSAKTVTNEALKSFGRNEARSKNQG
jgi:ketol-acid reductoisomerase